MGNQDQSTSGESFVIYKNILRNMQDGVITIGLDGKVMTFNEAAAKIFLLDEEQVIGEYFSKLFFSDTRNDAFNDVILRAIYDSSVTQHQEVPYYINEQSKTLLVSATFLFEKKSEKNEKFGIILVLSDISEHYRLDHIKALFGKYIDPQIAKRLIDLPEESLLKANRQMMTVSFCDMQGFSKICENLPPDVLVELMNAFFSNMSKSVYETNGVIDKFIGDSTMAFWGPPFSEAKGNALLGCRAALGQLKQVNELNKKVPAILGKLYQTFPVNVKISIGIATGDLVIGNIGSTELKNYTIMGNIVNLASRLVGANKVYGTLILVSKNTALEAQHEFEFREIDVIRVKGKEETSIIYELLGVKGELSETQMQFRDTYLEALGLYRRRSWQEAQKKFEHCIRMMPQDKASQVFLERIEYFTLQPPSENWDGVWTLLNK